MKYMSYKKYKYFSDIIMDYEQKYGVRIDVKPDDYHYIFTVYSRRQPIKKITKYISKIESLHSVSNVAEYLLKEMCEEIKEAERK